MVYTLPALEALKPVIAFINTVNLETPASDELATGERAGRWLRENGLIGAGLGANDDDAAQARELREVLRTLAMRNAGEPVEGRSTDLPAWCADECYRIASIDGELRLEPAQTDRAVRSALGAIVAIVYRAQREGTWARLKACRKHSCLWAFYDESKNRSGSWCSMSGCGNRVKAQRRRARERQSSPS